MNANPAEMSAIRYNYLCKKLREDINFLFVTQEILGHAFADFRGTASQLGIKHSEFGEEIDKINESLSWFHAWYNTAFADNPAQIECIGETGDDLTQRLKEIYVNG